jgi:adenylate kinase
MRKLAIEKQLEVIGQAANKISKETQDLIKDYIEKRRNGT